MFFISATQELLVTKIHLQAPTLAGPPQANQGDPIWTTPRQLTMYLPFYMIPSSYELNLAGL